MEKMNQYLEKLMNQRNITQEYNQLVQQAFSDPDVQAFLKANESALTPASIERSAPRIYEYVNEKKKIAAGNQGMIPGYSPQLKLSNHLIEVIYAPTPKLLAEQEARKMRSRVNASNMPKDTINASLADYYPQGREKAYLAALEFVNQYTSEANQFHQGLYITGGFGVGKTYLIAAIANELAKKGFNSTLIHFPTFTVEMKNTINSDSGNSNSKVEALKKAPILMLDDVGAESLSSWIRDDVLGIILQYRMQQELSTFFTSNENLTEFQEHLSTSQRGEVEPLKAARIMERVRFLAKEVEITGMNRRNQQVTNGK